MNTKDSISDISQDPVPPFFQSLREVDRLLLKAEQMIVASHSHSPFNNYLTQLSAEQARAVSNGISELRTAMLCLANREGVHLRGQIVNTAGVIRQTLHEALSKLVAGPPVDDVGRPKRHEGSLDAPEKLLPHMVEVFRRMDQILASTKEKP